MNHLPTGPYLEDPRARQIWLMRAVLRAAGALLLLVPGCASASQSPAATSQSPPRVEQPGGPTPTPIVNLGAVTTLAGEGTPGRSDGQGTAAQFNYPTGIAIDNSGGAYVGDFRNNLIRKISLSGDVTTLAGDGSQGFADGTGTTARLYYPLGVALDRNGVIYVADCGNNRIRKITSSGAVTTLAGGGSPGFADDTGTAARFDAPRGVALDGNGNVYVADTNNHRIRKITPLGVVTTLAGTGGRGYVDGPGTTALFNNPEDVALDGNGNVYVADTFNNRIRKITTDGVATIVAGSTAGFAEGTGKAALFNLPAGLVVDGNGNVYVADTNNHRIREITPAGAVTTLAGSGARGYVDGTGTTAEFDQPYHIALDSSSNLYVGDAGNHRIRRIR